MLKNLIRYGLSVAICGGAFVVSDRISQNLTRNAAIEFYETQKFSPDRDIQFSPGGLQTYTSEAAKQASAATHLPVVSVWLVSAGLVGIVFGSGSNTAINRGEALFQQWIKATQKNDSLTMARIENEVRDDGIGS
ncbi:MAG: hypothetical protein KME13_24285 [Myxacorys californica WJT36-NPBG1]|jgi:hypothetical protein|nr:hypothetical protein [Myxacorys californica WJT36-NPBG1]